MTENPPAWTVVIPVKRAEHGKSRLAASAELARAIAIDTIRAVASAASVTRVIVVTGEPGLGTKINQALPSTTGRAKITVLPETGAGPSPDARTIDGLTIDGLNTALGDAIDGISRDEYRAIVLGDLPALQPADLDAALRLAVTHPLAVVPDREGNGSTMITARPGVHLEPRFGKNSFQRHHAAGHVPLQIPDGSTLRCDVDTRAQLTRALTLGVGPATETVLSDNHAFTTSP